MKLDDHHAKKLILAVDQDHNKRYPTLNKKFPNCILELKSCIFQIELRRIFGAVQSEIWPPLL
jgi:hypothetical protein